jgi:transposase InsO family protein
VEDQERAELATVEWISWYNHARLHGEIGDVTPAEYEAEWRSDQAVPILTGPKQ